MKEIRPFSSAMKVLACTIGVIVGLFLVMVVALLVVGGSDEASWGLAWLFLLLASVALLVGAIKAVARLVDGISRRSAERKSK